VIFNIREKTSLISFSSVDHMKIFSSPKAKKQNKTICALNYLLGSVAVATIIKAKWIVKNGINISTTL